MREDILLKYVEKAGIQTGTLSALYDLSGFVDESEGVNKDFFYRLTSGYDNTLHLGRGLQVTSMSGHGVGRSGNKICSS